MRDALRSEAEVLYQLNRYERLRARSVKQRTLSALAERPKAIIAGADAGAVTQRRMVIQLA
jgi:hypothetical protein